MELAGRITTASNATFLGHIGTGDDTTAVVYKPVRGEKPLWDFPDHTLAHRLPRLRGHRLEHRADHLAR
ncbi:MAG: hypothetical protein WAW21_07840 [Corynebacterium variabile]